MALVDTLEIVKYPNMFGEGFTYRTSYLGNRDGYALTKFLEAGVRWQRAAQRTLSASIGKKDRISELALFFPHGDFDYGPEEESMRKGIGGSVLRTIAEDSYSAGARLMIVATVHDKMKSFLGKQGFKSEDNHTWLKLLSELV